MINTPQFDKIPQKLLLYHSSFYTWYGQRNIVYGIGCTSLKIRHGLKNNMCKLDKVTRSSMSTLKYITSIEYDEKLDIWGNTDQRSTRVKEIQKIIYKLPCLKTLKDLRQNEGKTFHKGIENFLKQKSRIVNIQIAFHEADKVGMILRSLRVMSKIKELDFSVIFRNLEKSKYFLKILGEMKRRQKFDSKYLQICKVLLHNVNSTEMRVLDIESITLAIEELIKTKPSSIKLGIALNRQNYFFFKIPISQILLKSDDVMELETGFIYMSELYELPGAFKKNSNSLKHLRIFFSDKISTAVFEYFIQALNNLKKLNMLDILIEYSSLSWIISFLGRLKEVETIHNIQIELCNKQSNGIAKEVIEALSSYKNISKIIWNERPMNFLEPRYPGTDVFESLKSMQGLKSLTITKNIFTKNIKEFCISLKSLTNLRSLNIRVAYERLENSELDNLFKSISGLGALENLDLDLSGMEITESGLWQKLFYCVRCLTKLAKLELSFHYKGEKDQYMREIFILLYKLRGLIYLRIANPYVNFSSVDLGSNELIALKKRTKIHM